MKTGANPQPNTTFTPPKAIALQLKPRKRPARVTIELSSRCNRLCRGCPRAKMNYPQGDMPLPLFQKVLGQLRNDTVIVPFFRGESLLHPKFEEMMRLLAAGGYRTVQLATNGDMLNIKNSAAILSACSFVSFSLHRYDLPHSSLYPKIVDFLYGAKLHGVQTQVSILDTMIPEAAGEKERFVQQWLRHADRVRIYAQHSRSGFGDVDRSRYKVCGDRLPCAKPFSETVVYWDGKVALCNHDWDNPSPLGDLNSQTLPDVWTAKPYGEVRRLHRAGKGAQVPSCATCDHWAVQLTPNRMFGELYVQP